MKEEAVCFGEKGSLVGIITDPPDSHKENNLPALIVLNSGALHRVGPNRLSVKIARKIAALGFICLRMDFSGIGDSFQSSFESNIYKRWVKETIEAMNFLGTVRGVKKFVLLGNCSGAAVSFFAASHDPRVVGAVLINLRGHKTLLRYYLKLALTNHKSWLRIVNGSANFRDLFEATRRSTERSNEPKNSNAYGANNFKTDLRVLLKHGINLLIVYSEWDPGLPYYYAYFKNVIDGFQPTGNSQVEIIRDIDHDFKLIGGQKQLIEIVHHWASQMVSK